MEKHVGNRRVRLNSTKIHGARHTELNRGHRKENIFPWREETRAIKLRCFFRATFNRS